MCKEVNVEIYTRDWYSIFLFYFYNWELNCQNRVCKNERAGTKKKHVPFVGLFLLMESRIYNQNVIWFFRHYSSDTFLTMAAKEYTNLSIKFSFYIFLMRHKLAHFPVQFIHFLTTLLTK